MNNKIQAKINKRVILRYIILFLYLYLLNNKNIGK